MAIITAAFGKRGYGYAAHNLALSLRFHGYTDRIILYAQRETLDNIDHALFDIVYYLEPHEYTFKGQFAPGYAKINVLNKMPDEEVLFLDADSLCLQNIYPLIEKLKHKDFSTIWMGEGFFGDDISYDPWAAHHYAWPFFGLEFSTKWTTTQTSMVWIKNNPLGLQVVRDMKYYFEKGYALNGLKEPWGKKHLPDELFASGAIARNNVDVKLDFEPVFFGVKNNPDKNLSMTEIEEKYYVLSMLGGAGNKSLTMPRFQEWYSRLIRVMAKKTERMHFEPQYIMRDKLLNE